MKKTLIIIIVTLTLVSVAFWAGTFLGRTHSVALESSFQAAVNIHLLDRLYAGDTNKVISVLDDLLDQNTISMGKSLHRPIKPRVRNQIEEIIPKLQTYRAEHPRTPITAFSNTNSPLPAAALKKQKRWIDELNERAREVLEYKTE